MIAWKVSLMAMMFLQLILQIYFVYVTTMSDVAVAWYCSSKILTCH